jgi:S1-C subfamily serine protease
MLKVQVALVCLVVLLVGAWLAPARDGDRRSAPPPERAAPLLEARASGRALDALGEAIAGATSAAQAFAVRIVASPEGPPRVGDIDVSRRFQRAGSGVVIGGGRVLTHVDALPTATVLAVTGAAGRVTATVLAFEPETGLVLLAAPLDAAAPPIAQDGLPVPALAPGAPASPALVVGVGRTAHAVAGQPAFVTEVDRDRFAVGLGAALAPGLPLFDAQGRLVAVAGASGAGEAFAVPAALARLSARVDATAPPVAFGIFFQGRQGALAQAFGPAGVIVADVVEGAPAAAGLEPGLLVLEIDGTAVDTTEAALAALRAAADRRTAATLSVRRRADRIARDVVVAPALTLDLWRLARADAPPDGLVAGAVFAAEVLAAGGVEPSARLLAIDGQPVRTDADLRRALRRPPPLVVAVLRGGRGRFVAALEPPR